eukprot:m.466799 g.466799  ORF g.466799 m.466799 type:complete len:226 (+) comp25557_c0_seq1:572-1249(+)
MGFAGSSSKFFLRSMGGSSTEEYDPRLPRLMVQERAWCSACVEANVTAKTLAGYDKCKMRPEFSPPTIVHIESAKPDAAKVALSRKKLGEYTQSLKVGDVVVVRSTPDDDGNTYDEVVYVAKLTKKAEKLTKTTRIAGETFSKGWWMCRIKWLWFVREDEEGSLFYRLKSRDEQPPPMDIPYAVVCFDPHCQHIIEKIAFEPKTNLFKLSSADSQAILRDGDLIA